MALQQEAGVNMLAGCLPILLQAPVFISLFHVLRIIKPNAPALYSWKPSEIASAANAKLFGAPIPAAFNYPISKLNELGGSRTATQLVTAVLIVCMVAATYLTQRMIMNRSVTQLDAQQAMIQKLMLYGMPASLAVSGFFFPVGILLYWFTNNLWTLGQQFYILRRMPMKTPTGAEKKPTIDPKLLAPKPGAKPLHPKNRRTQAITGVDGAAKPGDGSAAGKATPPAKDSGDGADRTAGPARTPRKSTPAKGTPAKAISRKAASAKAIPGKVTPAKGTPAQAGQDGAGSAGEGTGAGAGHGGSGRPDGAGSAGRSDR